MFHNWHGTDDSETTQITKDSRRVEVSCYQCGVTAPEWQYGKPYYVSVGHGPLPLWCEGADDNPSHHFEATGKKEGSPIECRWCGLVIDGKTLPDSVNWVCVNPEDLP
jgi:hypothetical protein